MLLRTYREEDAAELFETVNSSRAYLAPWLSWVSKTTKQEHSLQFIQQSQHELHTQQSLAMGIFIDGKLAGGIGMHQWEHALKRAQLGYWLAKAHSGKGIVARSIQALAQHLFDNVGLNKLEIHFVAANKRSAKVAERLGCKVEGIIRQGTIRNGIVEDLIITGLLKSEFQR